MTRGWGYWGTIGWLGLKPQPQKVEGVLWNDAPQYAEEALKCGLEICS